MSVMEGRRKAEADLWGYHQNWYAVAVSDEVVEGQPFGADFLGGRIVVYRKADGSPVVMSGRCPHIGLDLALGDVVDDKIRCSQHYFTFDETGKCTSIPSGDRIPSACRLFRYPSVERWGLIWAFNGVEALFDLPDRIGEYGEDDVVFRAKRDGVRNSAPWVTNSQVYDWVHLRYVHGFKFDENPTVEERDFYHRYDITFEAPELGVITQHTEHFGTNVVGYVTSTEGEPDSLALWTSTPSTAEDVVDAFSVIAAPRSLPDEVIDERLARAAKLADKVNEEDARAINNMKFREGTMVRADRSLVKFLQWVRKYPKANPGADYQ